MATFREGTGEQPAFRDALVAAGLLIPSGVHGLYGWGEEFERIRGGIIGAVRRTAGDEPRERLVFPPLVPRRQLEDVGYLRSFPHLAGAVFSFDGDEEAAGRLGDAAGAHEDWTELQQTALALAPAACYPVYPAIAARGPVAGDGVCVEVGDGGVFRHEPSGDPARMCFFHMIELIRIGPPETVQAWRDRWRDTAVALLRSFGLDAAPDVASDPFFGRAGRMLARGQRGQELKFEVLAPIAGDEPTAIASFNYHQAHFADAYGLTAADGSQIHTACLGFGLERVALALLWQHGLDPAGWPQAARDALWGSGG